MKPYEKTNIILNNILLNSDYVVGKNTILMKSGTIMKLKNKFNKLLYPNKKEKIPSNTKLTSLLEDYSSANDISKKNLLPMKHSLKNQCDLVYIQGKKDSNEKFKDFTMPRT